MNKFKNISLSILYIGSCISLYAQDTSYVSMSEADLVSLSYTLRKYKKSNLDNNYKESEQTELSFDDGDDLEEKLLKQRLIQLQSQLTENVNKRQDNYYNTNEKYATLEDVLRMEQQIWKLQQLVNQINAESNNTTTIIDTRPQNTEPKELPLQPSNDSTASYLLSLERKLDSLALLNSSKKSTVVNSDYTSEFEDLNSKMTELKGEINTKNNTPSDYLILKENYKNYNQKIFFENNSVKINTNYKVVIDELYEVLNSNETIDLVVKGFASNKGKLAYNEEVSMKRTEAIKKALLIKGIHPTRILTQYHGIDYKATTDLDARRVEISLLVRK